MQDKSLPARFRPVRRRIVLIGLGRAVAWGLVGAILLLLAVMWLDLLWELSPAGRIAAWLGAAGLAVVVVAGLLWTTFLASRDRPVAQRLDRAGDTGGEILTGLELGDLRRETHKGTIPSSMREDRGSSREISPRKVCQPYLGEALARMAVDRAVAVAATVPVARAAPVRPLGRSMTVLGGLLLVVGLLGICMPALARTQWDRFIHPTADVVPFSATRFRVSPGDVDVLYGGELEIEAAVEGPAVERAELVLETDSAAAEPLPMFPTGDGGWRAVLAKVTDETDYYVRSYGTRSQQYHIGVISVPQIEEVRVRVAQPTYANRSPYEGAVPKEGVAGLTGTSVRVWVRSNRPLSGGTITLTGGPTNAAMVRSDEGECEVVGQFEIVADGKFAVRVRDIEGQASQQAFSATVTLLPDERPFIRLVQPRKNSLATPDVLLPVSLAAEDDYGISRVQLYRSLNDSRGLPGEIAVSSMTPRRVNGQVYLPLAEYGLEPGDVVKLFGRVEDNDAAGAKGSESEVATVRIISQEEFERMVQAREGLEVLLSKYREAQRRMEGLAEETEGLRKKTSELPPDAPVDEQIREQLGQHLMRLRKESDALRKLMDHKMPFDLDNNLAPELEQVASMTDEMAEELEKLLAQQELLNRQAAKRLEELAKRLSGGREQYSQTVSVPLELLEVIFPLMVDQSRFELLALRQQDLAERLSAMKGRNGEDNPALKNRMRDLEQEQQEIRAELCSLLDDIEDNVKRLPEDTQFDRLRETATKFAEDVRSSGASEAMAEAEAGLAEFSGTRGYEKAKEAADILARFLKQCQSEDSMGSCCTGCLIFQPSLSNSMGLSISQLLAAMGLNGYGRGSGGGMGQGTGGYSSRRGSYGLYGGMPGMGRTAWNGMDGHSRDGRGDGQYGSGAGGAEDTANVFEPTTTQTMAGANDAAVPVQFRRRVGQYFERVAGEIGE